MQAFYGLINCNYVTNFIAVVVNTQDAVWQCK